MRKAVLLSISLVMSSLTGLPALGWEHSLEDLGDGNALSFVRATDAFDWADLTIGCVMGSGAIAIELISEDDAVDEQVGEVTFSIDGTSFTVPARLGGTNGIFLAWADGEAVWDVVRAIYGSEGEVALDVMGDTHFFGGANYSDAFGAMMDSCA